MLKTTILIATLLFGCASSSKSDAPTATSRRCTGYTSDGKFLDYQMSGTTLCQDPGVPAEEIERNNKAYAELCEKARGTTTECFCSTVVCSVKISG